MKFRGIFLLVLCVILLSGITGFNAQNKSDEPRVIVMTDGEIDDHSSTIRFLLYTCDFDVQAIIETNSMFQRHGHSDKPWYENQLAAYEEVHPKLIKHDPPTADELRARSFVGDEDFDHLKGTRETRWKQIPGAPVEFDPAGWADTPGSDAIARILLQENSSPVHLQGWGGGKTASRAFHKLKQDHADDIDYQIEADFSGLIAPGMPNVAIWQWAVFELSLKGPETGNPFLDVNLEATFSLGAKTITAQGFYDGSGIYKIRFMPDAPGEWNYKTKSSEKALDGVKGLLTCIESPGDKHGPVSVVDRYHFAYADGKRFFPVGTTLYCWQMERYDETLATLKHAGINKVRFMPFPHSGNTFPPFNPWEGSANNWDFDRPNPKFWQFIENAVRDLGERGIQADFIFFHPYESGNRQTWGLGPEMMTETQRKNYLSYAVRRLAAYNNIWWSMANEYNLIDTTLTYWEPLAETVANSDPYGHMHSIHNLPGKYYPGWNNQWVTHISIQDPDVSKISEWREQYQKPVINDEYQYDGNWKPWGNLTAEEATRRIWIATIEGGYATHGESYSPYSFFWKGGTPQRSSFARVSWLSEEVLNNDSKPLPGGLTPIDKVSAHAGSDYYLFYFGNEVTGEMTFTVPEGKEYMVDVLDTWNMTVTEMDGIYSGTFKIRWPSGKYMAVRIYHFKTK